jgi:hypothetical protein
LNLETIAEIYVRTLVSIEQNGVLVPIGKANVIRGTSWYVITAWNPGDARPTRQENDVANERLREVLTLRGLEPFRAVGADPDSDHFEESWAVTGIDGHDARAIGAEFGQVAVFRIADGAQTVLACTEDWSLSRPL